MTNWGFNISAQLCLTATKFTEAFETECDIRIDFDTNEFPILKIKKIRCYKL